MAALSPNGPLAAAAAPWMDAAAAGMTGGAKHLLGAKPTLNLLACQTADGCLCLQCQQQLPSPGLGSPACPSDHPLLDSCYSPWGGTAGSHRQAAGLCCSQTLNWAVCGVGKPFSLRVSNQCLPVAPFCCQLGCSVGTGPSLCGLAGR